MVMLTDLVCGILDTTDLVQGELDPSSLVEIDELEADRVQAKCSWTEGRGDSKGERASSSLNIFNLMFSQLEKTIILDW